jgi:hypothetical protein
MTDTTDARSKAEASHRLAELAKTPRARELFRRLAEEYESRARGELTADLVEQAEAAPSLVPAASLVPAPAAPDAPLAPVEPHTESEQWLASLASVREQS